MSITEHSSCAQMWGKPIFQSQTQLFCCHLVIRSWALINDHPPPSGDWSEARDLRSGSGSGSDSGSCARIAGIWSPSSSRPLMSECNHSLNCGVPGWTLLGSVDGWAMDGLQVYVQCMLVAPSIVSHIPLPCSEKLVSPRHSFSN